MSINSNEWYKCDTSAVAGVNATTYTAPGKFWVGVCLQKLTIPNKAFFTGVSTQNSPITAIINTSAQTTQLYNIMLILNYDAILEVDTQTKQLLLIQ